MFGVSKDQLLLEKQRVIYAQTGVLESQKALIFSLENKTNDLIEQLEQARIKISSTESEVARLNEIFADIGIDVGRVDSSGIWWSLAKDMINISVDETKYIGILPPDSKEEMERKAYAILTAKGVIKNKSE